MLGFLIEENRVLRRQVSGAACGSPMTTGEPRRARLPAGPARTARDRDHRHAGHVTPMAPGAHRAQVDLRKDRNTPSRCPRRNPPIGRSNGEENPTWGYTRILGALKNLGHHVGRSTSARILRTQGISPVPERPTSWQTFLRAHWGALAGADFFTTEVWTWRGLATFCTVCHRVELAAGSDLRPRDLDRGCDIPQHLEDALRQPAFLFDIKPTVAYNMRYTYGTSVEELNGDQFFRAENPPFGSIITYYLKNAAPQVGLVVKDTAGKIVRTLSGPVLGLHRCNGTLRPTARRRGSPPRPEAAGDAAAINQLSPSPNASGDAAWRRAATR